MLHRESKDGMAVLVTCDVTIVFLNPRIK